MKETTDKLLNAYKTLLKLYPIHFQNDYGEEMVIVFRNAYIDSAKISRWSVCKLGLRELRDLPTNLIREHGSDIWRRLMNTQNNFRETFPKSILKGIISFSVGFTLIYLIYCLIDTLLNSGNVLGQGNSIWNTQFYLHPTALAYSFGAVVMGMNFDKRRAWLSALGSFLVYTLLYRIWMIIPLEKLNNLISTGLEPYIFSTIAGLLVGSVIGLTQQGWKKTGWYALIGVIGFNLGWVVEHALSIFLYDHSPYVGTIYRLRVGDPWYFVYFLLPVIFYGVIIGIFMGLTTAGMNKHTLIINQE